MKIRTSVYCYSMCSIGCGSSRRKSDGIVVVASGEYYLGIGCFSAMRGLQPPLQAYTLHLRRPFVSFLVWLWLLDSSLIKINAVVHHLLHRWMTVIVVMMSLPSIQSPGRKPKELLERIRPLCRLISFERSHSRSSTYYSNALGSTTPSILGRGHMIGKTLSFFRDK